ncbi:FUSC family protein [Cystobacter ferrugineus]|uniref:Fusaric acid resistance protein n=1 Tax=Cystobacter ferrugineus TaxID=83449 RepID=A0A1L9BB61_9BACT|nr:FUSC family protein [Cystobacter ferrugineus]OJH39479.1 hypothetical protein BON30_18455 [Cystobacter ferrugineus]
MSLPGLSRHQLLFGLRVSLAALTALALALALHLPNPHWAAMTVWITAQPTRGMLAERLLFRLLGTAAGALAGMALLHVTQEPVAVVVALAIWVGLCVAVGNLLRHSISYGTLLAGYTAGVVALPTFVPALPHHDLAGARVLATLLGVVVSGVMMWLLTPESPRHAVLRQAEALGRDALAWAGQCLSGTAAAAGLAERERHLLAEMARIEESADQLAAGSPRAYARIRALRGLMMALLSLLPATRLLQSRLERLQQEEDPARAALLRAWRDALALRLSALANAPEAAPALPAPPTSLRHFFGLLSQAVAELQQVLPALSQAPATPPRRMTFHRDWPGARTAAARSALAVAGMGGVWLVTGWDFGPFLVMGASIFVSAFSSHPQPVVALRGVVWGASVGVALALLCRLVLLPPQAGMVQLLLTLAPFMVLGGLAMAHPVLGKPAIDTNMVFLLAAQPNLPLRGTARVLVEGGLALPLSALATLLVFRWLLPVDRQHRVSALTAALRRDIEGLAAARDERALLSGRSRLDHRVLRLVVQEPERLQEALAILRLGDALRLLRGLCMHRTGSALPHPRATAASLAEAAAALRTAAPAEEEAGALAQAALEALQETGGLLVARRVSKEF